MSNETKKFKKGLNLENELKQNAVQKAAKEVKSKKFCLKTSLRRSVNKYLDMGGMFFLAKVLV